MIQCMSPALGPTSGLKSFIAKEPPNKSKLSLDSCAYFTYRLHTKLINKYIHKPQLNSLRLLISADTKDILRRAVKDEPPGGLLNLNNLASKKVHIKVVWKYRGGNLKYVWKEIAFLSLSPFVPISLWGLNSYLISYHYFLTHSQHQPSCTIALN